VPAAPPWAQAARALALWVRIASLQAPELPAGLQPELLGQLAARRAACVKGLSLAAGAVEREHQLGLEVLA